MSRPELTDYTEELDSVREWSRKLGVGNAMGGPPIRVPTPNFLILTI